MTNRTPEEIEDWRESTQAILTMLLLFAIPLILMYPAILFDGRQTTEATQVSVLLKGLIALLILLCSVMSIFAWRGRKKTQRDVSQ